MFTYDKLAVTNLLIKIDWYIVSSSQEILQTRRMGSLYYLTLFDETAKTDRGHVNHTR